MLEIECLPQGEVQRSYSAYIDFENFSRLHAKKDQQSYPQDLEKLIKNTRTNLETSLAERANAEIYRTTYTLKNGLLYHGDIPFIEEIKNGQKVRENSGSNQIERERAEIASFTKVQQQLSEVILGEDAKIIVISPRKGIYQHNFYDIYSKNPDGPIQMRRFSSKSSYTEFEEAVRQIDPFSTLPQIPTDADFISSPLITYKTDEEIHALMQQDETTTSLEDLEKNLEAITPLKLDYLCYLASDPNWEIVKKKYNALLNGFDIASGRKKYVDQTAYGLIRELNDPATFWAASRHLSTLEVEMLPAGCGFSSGYKNGNDYGPQSVAEFSKFEEELELKKCKDCGQEEDHFHCPKDKGGCGRKIITGQGITECPGCHLTKEKAGSPCA